MGIFGSKERFVEIALAKVDNPKVEMKHYKKLIVLQPFVSSSGRGGIEFHMDPALTQGNHQNPFNDLHKELVELGDCAVIASIDLQMTVNQFGESVKVYLDNIFDHSPNMESMRENIRSAQDNVMVVVAEEPVDPRTMYVATKRPNVMEENNSVFFTLKDGRESYDTYPLYKSSLNENLIKILAGQDQNLLGPGSRRLPLSTETAGAASETFPETHPLVIFIQMFQCELELDPREFQIAHAEHSTDERFYIVSRSLLDRAREFIIIGGYSRLYTTTFQDTSIRIETSKPHHRDSVLKASNDSHWKPLVSFMLHVRYYHVHNNNGGNQNVEQFLEKSLTRLLI